MKDKKLISRKHALRYGILLSAIIFAGILIAIFAGRVIPATGDLPFYQKKATWQETMLYTRLAMLDHFNKPGQELTNPVQISPWYLAGPFKAENPEVVFSPEKNLDLTAMDAKGELLWHPLNDLKDNEIHLLPGKEYTTNYLWRKITVPYPISITGSFSGKDATEVWLNGNRIIHSTIPRGLEPDKERAQLHLKAGDNNLLMKIFTQGGSPGFYFKFIPEPLSLATFICR